MTDHANSVLAIDELQRRQAGMSAQDWSAYADETALNIEMLNDGDIEDMPNWAMISEDVRSFEHEGWTVKDCEGEAVRMKRADGSDIYHVPLGDLFLTFLDRA